MPFIQDLRYGVRTLGRTPGFTAIAVAVLALGIGVNATVFSLANAFFLRPLPVSDPGTIVRVYANRYSNMRYRTYLELRDRNSTLAGLAAFQMRRSGCGSTPRPSSLRRDRQRQLFSGPRRRGRRAAACWRRRTTRRGAAGGRARLTRSGRAGSAAPPMPSAARSRSTASRSRSSAWRRSDSPACWRRSPAISGCRWPPTRCCARRSTSRAARPRSLHLVGRLKPGVDRAARRPISTRSAGRFAPAAGRTRSRPGGDRLRQHDAASGDLAAGDGVHRGADGRRRAGAADRLRQRREPRARARGGPGGRDGGPAVARRRSRPADPSAADREPAPVAGRRGRRAGDRLLVHARC